MCNVPLGKTFYLVVLKVPIEDHNSSIFMNDLFEHINALRKLFADDTWLLSKITNQGFSHHDLNQDQGILCGHSTEV